MEIIQQILVYIVLILAVGYLAKVYLLPKRLKAKTKSSTKSCGQSDCGCS